MKRIGILTAAACVVLLALSAHAAVAQTARTISIVVPFPAGVAAAPTVHLPSEMLKRAADMNSIHVPYRGGEPSVTAILGGPVTAVIANYIEVDAQLAAGTLRGLAGVSGRRSEWAPIVPTVIE